jgi:hypothetical protein
MQRFFTVKFHTEGLEIKFFIAEILLLRELLYKGFTVFLIFCNPFSLLCVQARTGRGIHGLPKVSPGPAMPDPSSPCRAGGLRPFSTPLNTPSRTGLVST